MAIGNQKPYDAEFLILNEEENESLGSSIRERNGSAYPSIYTSCNNLFLSVAFDFLIKKYILPYSVR